MKVYHQLSAHHTNTSVWEMLLRGGYYDKNLVDVLGIKTNRSERPPILPKLKITYLPTAPDFKISNGELTDRLETIDSISRVIERAANSFLYTTDTFLKKKTKEIGIPSYIVILEMEVRILQDILRCIPTLKEEELQDWQKYIEALRAEIEFGLDQNSSRFILFPERAYAELREKLYAFARLGVLPIYRVMRWRELVQLLTPAKVSYSRSVKVQRREIRKEEGVLLED